MTLEIRPFDAALGAEVRGIERGVCRSRERGNDAIDTDGCGTDIAPRRTTQERAAQ